MITPILRKPHTDAESSEDNAEARMRQALGKLGTAKSGKLEAPRRAFIPTAETPDSDGSGIPTIALI